MYDKRKNIEKKYGLEINFTWIILVLWNQKDTCQIFFSFGK